MSKLLGFLFILWEYIYPWYKCSTFYYLCFSDVALGFKCPINLNNTFCLKKFFGKVFQGWIIQELSYVSQIPGLCALLPSEWDSSVLRDLPLKSQLGPAVSCITGRSSRVEGIGENLFFECPLRVRRPFHVACSRLRHVVLTGSWSCVSVARKVRLSWLAHWIRGVDTGTVPGSSQQGRKRNCFRGGNDSNFITSWQTQRLLTTIFF